MTNFNRKNSEVWFPGAAVFYYNTVFINRKAQINTKWKVYLKGLPKIRNCQHLLNQVSENLEIWGKNALRFRPFSDVWATVYSKIVCTLYM